MNVVNRINVNNLAALFTSVILGCLFFTLLNHNVKYAIYLFLFIALSTFFITSKMYVLKVSIVLFLLIFIDNVIVYSRSIAELFVVNISVIFAVVLILSSLRNSDRMYGKFFHGYCWLFFLLISFVSIFTSVNLTTDSFFEQIIIFQTRYLEFFMFFIIGYLVFEDIDDVDKILKVIILFCGLIAAVHILSLITGYNLEGIRGPEAVTQEQDLSNAKNWRYGAFFGNPNYMAAFYAMVLPVCLIYFFGKQNHFFKIVCLLMVCLIFVSTLLTGSRGGVIFVLVNTLLLLVYYKSSFSIKVRNVLFFVIFSLITYVVFENYFAKFLINSMDRMVESSIAGDVRWQMWLSTLKSIADNPFGIGIHPDNFANLLYDDIGVYLEHPHNAYLSIIVSNSIFAFLLLAKIVTSQISGIAAGIRGNDLKHTYISYCMMALIMGFLLSSISNGTFGNNYKTNHIFALVLGIAAFVNHKNSHANARPHIDRISLK